MRDAGAAVVGRDVARVVGVGVDLEGAAEDGGRGVGRDVLGGDEEGGGVRVEGGVRGGGSGGGELRADVADGRVEVRVHVLGVVFVEDFFVDDGGVFGLLGEVRLQEQELRSHQELQDERCEHRHAGPGVQIADRQEEPVDQHVAGREETEELQADGQRVPDGELPDVARCIGVGAGGGGGVADELLDEAEGGVGGGGVDADAGGVGGGGVGGEGGFEEAVVTPAEEGVARVCDGCEGEKRYCYPCLSTLSSASRLPSPKARRIRRSESAGRERAARGARTYNPAQPPSSPTIPEHIVHIPHLPSTVRPGEQEHKVQRQAQGRSEAVGVPIPRLELFAEVE